MQNRWRLFRQPYVLFSLFTIVLLISGHVEHVLFLRPTSEHQWRQCDAASQALNYYQNDVPFLTPQYHSLLGENGHGASEFPIVYYTVAQLYKLFGFHEYIFRIVSLLIFLTGMFCLFKTGLLLTKNTLLSFIPVIFYGTSPVYFFYADNFLPNVHAISFSLIGFYFFFRYAVHQKAISIFWYSLFFALAALIKAPEGMGFVAIQGIYLFGLTNRFAALKPFGRKHIVYKLLSLMIVTGVAAGWIMYTKAFNIRMHNLQSLQGIIPIWRMDGKAIDETITRVRTLWLHEIHSYIMWGIVLIACIYFIRYFRSLHPLLRVFTLFMGIGAFVYCLLWFEAFFHHDYYLMTPLIFPCFILITCVEHLARRQFSIRLSRFILAGSLAILCYLFINNFQLQRFRYSNKQRYPNLVSPINTIEPYLRSIGITRSDKIISVPDISPSNTLYLMNNPGWTEAFTYDGNNIVTFAGRGAQYLIIADSSYLQNPLYQPYITHQVGAYHGVLIYQLQH